MTTLETGEYVIRNESEVLTVGFTPDVLLMRSGEYTKLKDTDVILGKLEIGNVYYNSIMKKNITLTEDIPHKTGLYDEIAIRCSFDNGNQTSSSLKYLSIPEVKHKFNVGDKVKMIDGSICNDKGTGEIVKLVRKNTYDVKLLTLDTGLTPPTYTLLYEEFQLEPLADEMTSGDWVVRKVQCNTYESIEVYNSKTGLVAASFPDVSNGWFRIGNAIGGNQKDVYSREQMKHQK